MERAIEKDENRILRWNKKLRLFFQYSVLPVLVLLAVSVQAYSQDDGKKTFYRSITAGYVIGAQLYNDNILYNPGYSFQASLGMAVNEDISAGFGLGYMPLEGEQFAPLFVEIIGYRKKKKRTSFIRYQLGYAPAWEDADKLSDMYEINGGPFFNFATGRKIAIDDSYSMFFQFSYSHQFAELEYELFGDQEYTDRLNFDMLMLSIGLVLEN